MTKQNPAVAPCAAGTAESACLDQPGVIRAWTRLRERETRTPPGDRGFFPLHGCTPPGGWHQAGCTIPGPRQWWDSRGWEEIRQVFGDPASFASRLQDWVEGNRNAPEPRSFSCLTLRGGSDKSGNAEDLELEFRPGDVVCLVGPTGAGKSRLLGDVECLAQGDTPSRRQVLLDGQVPDELTRFHVEHRLVAQITQNMNFVMDLPVGDFLRLHAASRGLEDADALADQVLEQGVALAGEPFGAATPLTQLSGGQSRALMIADAAFLSPKPIVLIDEIENAGVDRRKALDLFTRQGKLVFLSTHDPLLALSGTCRLVIRNGGIHRVLPTSEGERALRDDLTVRDRELSSLREALRRGEELA